MSTVEIVVIAVALAMDAFSVAASVGPRVPARWGAARLAASFGGFQGGMPLLGAVVGSLFYVYVRSYDHWIAFGLLELVGVNMVVGALRHWREEETQSEGDLDPSRGLSLLGLSVATSIDAFGAGMGMRMAGANMWLAAALIAAITAGLTYLGAGLGMRAEQWLGRKAELLGGLVLVALGFKMLGM